MGSCTHNFGTCGEETAWQGQAVEKTAQFAARQGKRAMRVLGPHRQLQGHSTGKQTASHQDPLPEGYSGFRSLTHETLGNIPRLIMVTHLTYLDHPHMIKNDLKEKNSHICCLGVLLLVVVVLLFVYLFLRQVLTI